MGKPPPRTMAEVAAPDATFPVHNAPKGKRLCERYQKLAARGKLKVQVCTAIARELVGFIWDIGQTLPSPAANG